jgi:hypothetical protein
VRKRDDPNDFLFNFKTTEGLNISLPVKLNTMIPQGPEYDSYNLQIIIKIIDDSGAVLEYVIPTLVSVSPNISLIENSTIIDQIINYDKLSNENRRLHEGDLRTASQIVTSISAIINSECNKDKNSLINSGIKFYTKKFN